MRSSDPATPPKKNLDRAPYQTFYYTIQGCNDLEEEYAMFQKLIDQGKSEQEALQILRFTSQPKTGPENYQWLNNLWNEN